MKDRLQNILMRDNIIEYFRELPAQGIKINWMRIN